MVGLVVLVAIIGFSIFNGGNNRRAVNPAPEPPGTNAPAVNPAPEPPSSSAAPSQSDVWRRLDTGYISGESLTYEGTPVVCLCVDEKAWDELLDDQNKGDLFEIALLVLKLKVALVPRGTRVKCIERGFESLKLRVSEGHSAGVEGWLDTELVSKGEPRPPAKKRKPTLQSQTLTTEQMARARFQIGRNLEKDGKDELAVTAYRELVKRFPHAPQAKQAAERIKALTGK